MNCKHRPIVISASFSPTLRAAGLGHYHGAKRPSPRMGSMLPDCCRHQPVEHWWQRRSGMQHVSRGRCRSCPRTSAAGASWSGVDGHRSQPDNLLSCQPHSFALPGGWVCAAIMSTAPAAMGPLRPAAGKTLTSGPQPETRPTGGKYVCNALVRCKHFH